MNYEDSDSLKELFPAGLFDGGGFDDSPAIDNLLNDSFSKHDSVSLDIATVHNTILNVNDTNATTAAVNNVNSVLSDIENSLITNTSSASYAGLLNTTNNSGVGGANSSFEDVIPSISMADLLSPKDELPSPPMDAIAPMGNALQTVECKLSPSYSCNSELWDSGVSADDESSPQGLRLDQQLSPLSDYTAASPTPDYLSSFNSPRPLCTPLRSPSSSAGSGYSSSTSPSSSPNSSPLPTLATPPTNSRLHFTTVPAVTSSTTVASSNVSKINTNPDQQPTISTPQFLIQKRPNNKFTINSKAFNNCLTTINKQPITVVSTTTNSSNINTGATRLTPTRVTSSTIINRSHQLATTTNNTAAGAAKLLQHKSSPSPSVVTLSGVNKTAGIIKSPSVISISRKQPINIITSTNAINNNNNNTGGVGGTAVTNNNSNANSINGIQQQKPISIISTSGELVSRCINNSNVATSGGGSLNGVGGKVFKALQLTNGHLTSAGGGQFFITTPRNSISNLTTTGKILKSQNNSIIIPINTKNIDKVRQIRFISNCSNSSNGRSGSSATTLSVSPATVRGNGLLRSSFVTSPNRTRINGVSTVTSSSGLRSTNVSILKNLCVSMGNKTLQSVKDGGSDLVTIPKEEILDSDDELELPKNNQPLLLTDDEKKLAAKECTKFPSHYPLSRSQERDLKRIRRKLRNKQSAQDSRKRKKAHLDSLMTDMNIKSEENDRLKVQLATLEETNKKLSEQLKQFQVLMNSQAAPSVTRSSNNSHNHHHGNSSRQQHPSTFLLMMVLSVALFVYPSVLPQSKTATELLTAVAHRMPSAGNTRSLLEAATKLSVCHDDDSVDDDIDLDSKSIAALTDHDYEPPSKRGRYNYGPLGDGLYCMPQIDDQLPSPRKKQLPDGGGGGRRQLRGGGGGGDTKGSGFGPPDEGYFSPPDDDPAKPNKSVTLVDDAVPSVGKFESDIPTKFSRDVLDSMMTQLENNHNWTQPDLKKPIDAVVSQSLVVELATTGSKLFREDIELE